MKSTFAEKSGSEEKGTVLMALLIYLTTNLFIWFFTIPAMGLFAPTDSQSIATGPALESHLEYARNQALQRQRPVTVCASDNGRDCSGSSQWKAGWIVFTDSDRNPGQFSPDDELLYAYVGEKQRSTLEINVKYVRYLENGVIELN